MSSTIRTLAALAVLLGLAHPAPGQPSSVRKDIESVNQQFAAAFEKGDTAAIAALYTPDGEALPPNGEVVHGREAIQAMWQSVLGMGIASVGLTTRELESAGDLAWEGGTYELRGKDGTPADRGKYIVIWKREQGQWRIHRDIWNTSLPARP